MPINVNVLSGEHQHRVFKEWVKRSNTINTEKQEQASRYC